MALETDLNNFYKDKKSKDGYMGVCKKCKKNYDKEYVLKNKEKTNLWKNNYRLKNIKKENEKCKLYREKNKEKIALYAYKYSNIPENKERKNYLRKLKYKTPNQEIKHELYLKDKANSKIRMQKYRSNKKQVFSNFNKKDWENCKNHFNNKCAYCGSDGVLHQEHFVPLSKGGEYTVENIIPACKRCNSSKSNNSFEIWYIKQPYYNKESENKILRYLNRR
jgi:5-methylcytosine-specific restriction endonuclease McrA